MSIYLITCTVDQDPKNPNRWISAYMLRETEYNHNNEDGTENTVAIEKRNKDTCDDRADEWADDVLERLAYLTVRATDLHAGCYHKDYDSRFFSG